MTTFLTSSPTGPLGVPCDVPGLDRSNGFVELLAERWPGNARCLMIAAFPKNHAQNDQMTWFYSEAVKNAGLETACFDLWDDRTAPMSREMLQSYDVIFTAGGHVPTQRRWFESIRLRELLEGYGGLVVGTSAGSMNAAVTVYGWPEEPGESIDPNHELFFPGLGLAETIVLPHYQMMKDAWLDGKRLFEDITFSHSHGHKFYAIPDGSFVLVEDGAETLYGESWLITDGKMEKFSEYGEKNILK
jgi:dipeptidase E